MKKSIWQFEKISKLPKMSSRLLFSGQLNLLLPRSPYNLCHRLIHKNDQSTFDRSKDRKKSGSKFSEMLEDSVDRNLRNRESSTRDSSSRDWSTQDLSTQDLSTRDSSFRDSLIQESSTGDSSTRDSFNQESSFEIRPHTYRRAPFSQHIKKLELKTIFQVPGPLIIKTSYHNRPKMKFSIYWRSYFTSIKKTNQVSFLLQSYLFYLL